MAVQLFFDLQYSGWRLDNTGYKGLDIASIHALCALYNIDNTKIIFQQLKIMEHAALKQLYSKKLLK